MRDHLDHAEAEPLDDRGLYLNDRRVPCRCDVSHSSHVLDALAGIAAV